jgi:hypothetical protein
MMKKAGKKMHLQVTLIFRVRTVALAKVSLALSCALQGHYVGLPGGVSKKLFAPVDIEGHLGTDGRYYVVVRTEVSQFALARVLADLQLI